MQHMIILLLFYSTCRLRLQLLTTWTVCVKRIGRVVILYFGLILKDWDEDSVSIIYVTTFHLVIP